MPSLELTALLITWLVVIPLLVIFPPAKIIWLRRNIEYQRNARKVQTVVLSEHLAAPSDDTNNKNDGNDDEKEENSDKNSSSTMRKRTSNNTTKKETTTNANKSNNNNNNSTTSIGLKNYIIPSNSQIVLVFVNPKSGGRLGEDLLYRMREILNPNQVFDLSQKNIDVKAILRSFSTTASAPSPTKKNDDKKNVDNNASFSSSSASSYDNNIRILIAGGDGSIGWVITSCLAIGKKYPVGILPLGTGNDLARSVGWGSGATKTDVTREALTNRIAEVLAAKAAPFDHWTIEIDENVDEILKARKSRQRGMSMVRGEDSSSFDNAEEEDELEVDDDAGSKKKSKSVKNSSFTAAEDDAMMKRLNSTRRKTKSVSPTSTDLNHNDVVVAAAAGDMPHQSNSPSAKTKKVLSMFNYISVGIDAEIALRFHAEREEFPEEFSSQAANLVRYARLGFEKSFDSRPLNDRVEVYRISSSRQQQPEQQQASLDPNNLIPFHPAWKCLMFSNILYYQRKNFWGDLTYDDAEEEEKSPSSSPAHQQQQHQPATSSASSSFSNPLDAADAKDFKSASVQDGILECMSMSGTLHFGIVHCNLDHALRVAQEEGFELLLTEPGQAIQLDGEPWVQSNPCKIKISRAGQYPMLRGTGGGEWWNKIIG